jgi:hypothetical protein
VCLLWQRHSGWGMDLKMFGNFYCFKKGEHTGTDSNDNIVAIKTNNPKTLLQPIYIQ